MSIEKKVFDVQHFCKRHLQIKNDQIYTKFELFSLIDLIIDEFRKEPTLAEISPPVRIVGDIHGQHDDLVRLLNCKNEGNTASIDDRKPSYAFSTKKIPNFQNFVFQILFPKQYVLLRGNHETKVINFRYGFRHEILRRLTSKRDAQEVWERFNDAFSFMPLACLVGHKILCMHGGISPDLVSLDAIRMIQRPLIDVNHNRLAQDLLWADPEDFERMLPSTTVVSNLPWVEKYRPSKLNELVAHEQVVKTLTKFIENRTLPHLLFYGPPGTGKTTTVLAAARKMYHPSKMSSMVLELNASDERGIDVVRNTIVNFAQTKGLQAFASASDKDSVPFKLVILDEADAMTKDAQNALRRVIEKYTDNVRFCIICNYLASIIPAIQSRCTRFRFAPLDQSLIVPRLDFIVKSEGLQMTPDGREALLRVSKGDMRTVINTLQSTAMSFEVVSESTVYQCIGQPTPAEMKKVVTLLLNQTAKTCMNKIKKSLFENGYALQDVITHLHDLAFSMDIPDSAMSAIIVGLGEVEENLSTGCSNETQLAAVVAAFFEAKSCV
ncbi:Protein CBG22959 [Caenorhabditis briggsae]|uniref:Serine/threonine-protein phosphatase n=1 Tax=Caenorhabditis briggsae TaxID=6238 RepID=A8Y3K6_CAEBR|nr:Protein CBG22959 [Caenorhabditis briggsae]CAP39475.2 Protein CBG22959 [Caenorhabditis briggsae]